MSVVQRRHEPLVGSAVCYERESHGQELGTPHVNAHRQALPAAERLEVERSPWMA